MEIKGFTNKMEPFENLANAVVIQAVNDWRYLRNRLAKGKELSIKDEKNTSFKTLQKFFNSNWCEALCQGVDVSIILDEIKREYQTAQNENGGM